MTEKVEMTKGSGNVFADLGFGPEEAENLLLRAQLMSRISDLARGLPQREAAKQFGITQPRLNDLLRGKIGKFSLDALVNMLSHAGMRVEMTVCKAAEPRAIYGARKVRRTTGGSAKRPAGSNR